MGRLCDENGFPLDDEPEEATPVSSVGSGSRSWEEVYAVQSLAIEELTQERNEAWRMVQNCILAGKYHQRMPNEDFWGEAEAWLDKQLNA